MRTFAKSRIRYSKSQRMGIFAFIVLILGFEAYDIFINKSQARKELIEISHLSNTVTSSDSFKLELLDSSSDLDEFNSNGLNAKQSKSQAKITLLSETESKPKESKVNYKKFDPNVYSQQDWESLGFTEKQAETILKYKNSLGGTFNTLDEIKNCFVISDKKFAEMRPFIELKTPKPTVESKANIQLVIEDEEEPIEKSTSIKVIED